jgi:TP901 family phage tail tape measure protein
MAFEVKYIFIAINKFSKVANKIYEDMDKIDKKVQKTTSRLEKFQTVGAKSFARVSKATDKAADKVEKFTRRQKKANFAMRGMVLVAGNLKFRLASLLVTLTMTGFGLRKIIRDSSEVEKSFLQLSALTGFNEKSLALLRKEAFRFSRVFGTSFVESYTGFKRVAGLKPELLKDVEELKKLTKWTLIVNAPMERIEKISRALTISLNVYGKSAKSAARFSNILAAAQRKGSAEVIDLALSFLKAGPAAEIAGLKFAQVVSMLEAVAHSGNLAQKSGTALRTLFIRLADLPKKFRGKDMLGTLEKVKKHLESFVDDQDKLAEAGRIFGKFQASVGIELTKNLDLSKRLFKEIQGTNIALETAKVILSGYEKQSNAIFSFWENMKQTIFDKIKPHLLDLQRQFMIFIEIMNKATPGGFAGTIKLLIWGLTKIMQLVNVVTFSFGILFALFRAGLGDITALTDIPELYRKIKEIEATPLSLESILTPEEKAAGASKTTGKVSIDLNLRGNTEAVDSVHGSTDGDVDLNIGKNFGFIG